MSTVPLMIPPLDSLLLLSLSVVSVLLITAGRSEFSVVV
jgi:hypothetical protein